MCLRDDCDSYNSTPAKHQLCYYKTCHASMGRHTVIPQLQASNPNTHILEESSQRTHRSLYTTTKHVFPNSHFHTTPPSNVYSSPQSPLHPTTPPPYPFSVPFLSTPPQSRHKQPSSIQTLGLSQIHGASRNVLPATAAPRGRTPQDRLCRK